MPSNSDYVGKVVVITEASSGLGKATALKLARRGASVVAAARGTDILNDLASQCEAAGGQARAVTTHDTEFFEHAGNDAGGEAVPIPPTYDPQVTIDKFVKLVAEPEDEVTTHRVSDTCPLRRAASALR